MQCQSYQRYVLNSVHVSRQSVSNVHKCPQLTGVSFQISPLAQDQHRLLGVATLLGCLSGRSPSQLFKVSRRSKERLLCGARVTLRKAEALNAISALRTLSFYYSVNFRGFNQTTPNKSASLSPKHLGFFLGARRAFDTGLLGFEDSGLAAHIVFSFTSVDAGSTTLRGLRAPVYA